MTRRSPSRTAIGGIVALLLASLIGVLWLCRQAPPSTDGPRKVAPSAVVSTSANREASPIGKQAPISATLQVPALSARLEHFRDLLRRQRRAMELRTSESESLFKQIDLLWRDLHQAVFEDPETYLAVLRAPESEEVSEGLLGLLSRAHVSPEHQLVTVGMDALPGPLLQGLKDLLVSGKEGQKVALLKMIEVSNHLDHNSTKPFVDRCKELLAEGNPQVQRAALGVLAARTRDSLDPYFELVRELAKNPGDADGVLRCLALATRMRRPEAEDFFVQGIAEVLEGRGIQADPRMLQQVVGLVSVKVADLKDEKAAVYASLIDLGLRRAPNPDLYQRWTAASLGLPVAQMAPILQEVEAHAPTAGLRDAAHRVLAQLRSGETSREALRKAFSEAAK